VEHGKILIVDDEPLMCDSLKILLTRDGYETRTSCTGREAMDCFVTQHFDVVLLDMHIPDMNGLQLMDHIRKQCPEAFVVVITGHASVDSTVESLRRGAFDYLRKPFEHEELLKTVKNAMNQKALEKSRQQAEEELRKAHEGLERRVEERTRELAETNIQLRREIEERKRAEKELQEMNDEVKDFVRAVSHDLKNPIISVQGFSSRLLKHFGNELGKNGRAYVDHILANARRMERLVSDLLTLSMIGRLVPDLQDVSCEEIVREVFSSLESRINDKGVRVVIPENLPRLFCDRIRIYQVFENLISNAIKFVGDVKDPRVEIGYRDEGILHRFSVKDNGIGIAPESHQAIFEKFCRLKEVKDEEGTGLGLPIVEKILERFGGEVWVDSEKGKGAAFHFTLPKTSVDL